MTAKLQKAYSLIELMVVVAIIGIIATVAYPSYQSYTCDTYVSQAVADLKLCALAMDRYYSDDFTYVGAVIDGTGDSVCTNQSPADTTARFNITLTTATANNYVIQAAPAAGQSCGGTMTLAADGTLTEL